MKNKYKLLKLKQSMLFKTIFFIATFFLICIFLLSSQLTLAQTAAFPLKYSANKKYLVDQNNVPFIIKEHSAWGAIQALTESAAADFPCTSFKANSTFL